MQKLCKKKLFFSEAEAKKFATRIAKMMGGRRQRAYKCEKCNLWHLTTQPKKGK